MEYALKSLEAVLAGQEGAGKRRLTLQELRDKMRGRIPSGELEPALFVLLSKGGWFAILKKTGKMSTRGNWASEAKTYKLHTRGAGEDTEFFVERTDIVNIVGKQSLHAFKEWKYGK